MTRPAYQLPFAEPVAAEPDVDPYEYGWRERREVAADGTEKLSWDPLTYPDLLDPQEGDVVAEDSVHRSVTDDMARILKRRYEDDPGVAVWCSLKILFRIPGLTTGPGPDICLVEGVDDRDLRRTSFRYGQEPGKVRLVVEVVSKKSVQKDYQDLLAIYGPLGVEEYVAIRPLGFYPQGPFRLRGWQRDAKTGRLRPLQPDRQGRLHSQVTGLLFGTGAEGWGIELWDAATGERLRTSEAELAWHAERTEQAIAQADEAELQARDARDLAEEAERRARIVGERAEQEAEARRAAEKRAEKEARRAEKAAARAKQEAKARRAAEKQAEQEATARRKAEQAQQEMAAELARLRALLEESEDG